MAAMINHVRKLAMGNFTCQIAARLVSLPYLMHRLPCALSDRQHRGDGRTQRPRTAWHRLPGKPRGAAGLVAAWEQLTRSCSAWRRCPSPVRIG